MLKSFMATYNENIVFLSRGRKVKTSACKVPSNNIVQINDNVINFTLVHSVYTNHLVGSQLARFLSHF